MAELKNLFGAFLAYNQLKFCDMPEKEIKSSEADVHTS